MANSKRILFIGHDAGRSGAPIVLLHLINWLKARDPQIAIDVLLLRGGELENEYRKSTDVFVLPPIEDDALLLRGLKYLRDQYFQKRKLRTARLAPFRRSYDVVLGNTVATLDYLEFFKRKGFRTISWVHELEYAVSQFFSKERFVELSASVDRFIAASKAVESMLDNFGLKVRSSVIYEFSKISATPTEDVNAIKRQLGIPAKAFLVGGGGSVEWRKGTDLFLQIASQITKKNPEIFFVWVGGRSDRREREFLQVEYDRKRLGLEGKLLFTGITKEPQKYLSMIDVFALSSREDPFPLVGVEAAGLGKPVICFADAGGMPEFVGGEAGVVVAYGDTAAFSESILDFYADREELGRAGKAAAKKIASQFSMDAACSQIEELLLGG